VVHGVARVIRRHDLVVRSTSEQARQVITLLVIAVAAGGEA
jgi:hypothetical protein